MTSWRPFWANDAYNLRDLEDPRGAMGEPEALHFLGTSDFSERFPEAAELIAGIQLDDAQYASLEDMVVNEYGAGQGGRGHRGVDRGQPRRVQHDHRGLI